ncbi:anthranilate synthase component II [Halocatena halophila]|uniref:anthranilate synthase component II n=1 Tax=Halocatena halophila TaxID=2814576 RepID=UPI002ED68F30
MTTEKILVIDNYDSFAYNLVQYVGEAISQYEDTSVVVRRNDAIDVAGIERLNPAAIVVSPGPGTPSTAGVSVEVFADCSYPTLGVCLGHQALCVAAGGTVNHAPAVVHGKPSTVTHDGRGIFEGLSQELSVGRYHSLAVTESLPPALIETATTTDERIVMGVRHRNRPHVGVQFHPESILTADGYQLIETFCDRALTDDPCTFT